MGAAGGACARGSGAVLSAVHVWILECDSKVSKHCERTLDDDEGAPNAYADKADLLETATESFDWLIEPSGRAVCSKCVMVEAARYAQAKEPF